MPSCCATRRRVCHHEAVFEMVAHRIHCRDCCVSRILDNPVYRNGYQEDDVIMNRLLINLKDTLQNTRKRRVLLLETRRCAARAVSVFVGGCGLAVGMLTGVAVSSIFWFFLILGPLEFLPAL